MKKEVAFIALGQCGGNIGKSFQNNDFNVLFVNSAKEDLDLIKADKKYHLTSGEGCNKDRTKAKMLLKSDVNNLVEYINENLSEEFVFLIGSAGGGTGSGILPLLTQILCNSKKVGIITVLPNLDESVQAHINTYEMFKELSKIEKLGSMFILDNNNDNNKLNINDNFVKLFTELLNVREHNDVNGNIDKAELKQILMCRGCTVISKQSKGIDELFKRIKNSNTFSTYSDEKVLKYVLYSSSIKLDRDELINNFGIPQDIYINSGNKKTSLLVLAGLPIPTERFKRIKNDVEKSKEELSKNQNALNNLFSDFEDDLNIETFNKNDYMVNENKIENKKIEILSGVFDDFI